MIPIRHEMELQTGDILLFRGTSWLSYLIEFFGQSAYSHVGIILKNPSVLGLEDGLYLWDASYGYTPDAEEHKKQYGVHIHKVDDILPLYPYHSVYVRRLHIERTEEMMEQLAIVHHRVHGKPYNLHLYDWMASTWNMNQQLAPSYAWRQTSRFWCSALVAYIYHEMGWVSDVNWSIIAPREFSSKESTGQLLFTSVLSDEVPLL